MNVIVTFKHKRPLEYDRAIWDLDEALVYAAVLSYNNDCCGNKMQTLGREDCRHRVIQ